MWFPLLAGCVTEDSVNYNSLWITVDAYTRLNVENFCLHKEASISLMGSVNMFTIGSISGPLPVNYNPTHDPIMVY